MNSLYLFLILILMICYVSFLKILLCKTFPLQIQLYGIWRLDYEDYKNWMHSSSLNLWHHLPTVALPILNIGNYQQNSNELIKNQGEKKRYTFRYKKQNVNAIVKLESLWFITYIDELIGLFIFSVVNDQRKCRIQSRIQF